MPSTRPLLPVPALIATLLVAASAACSSGGTSEVDRLAAGSLPVIDTSAVICTELTRPGDSLPPRINAASMGPGGVIAWNPLGMAILILRYPDGREVRIDGMAGESRFASVSQMGWIGDTLWITDAGSNRIQRFRLDGTPVGVLLAPDIAGWRLLPTGVLRATAPRGFNAQGVSDTMWALIGAAPGTHKVDTVATLASGGWTDVILPRGPELNPFSITSLVGMALDGSRWCMTKPVADGVHLVCLDASGAPLFDKALQVPQRTVPNDVYQAVARGVGIPPGFPSDSGQKLLPYPDSLPFAFNIRFGRDGSSWILRSHRSEAEQVWLRLSPDGSALDEVHIGSDQFLLDFSGDSLWVAERVAASLQRLSQCVIRK